MRLEDNYRHGGDLIVLVPVQPGSDTNIVRVQRYHHNEDVPGEITHIAGGPYTGIVVRKFESENNRAIGPSHLSLSFQAYVRDASTGVHKQELRQLGFYFGRSLPDDDRHNIGSQFFKDIMHDFPKDYVSFVKRVLQLMQRGYDDVRTVEINTHIIQREVLDESVPEAIDTYDASQECESVTAAHVQEVLEIACPSSITVSEIAHSLRCSDDEILTFLRELQERQVAVYDEERDVWTRYEHERHGVASASSEQMSPIPQENGTVGVGMTVAAGAATSNKLKTKQPTVAIITNLFVEKLAVEALIDNKRTMHRYKTDGESNMYTIGDIGAHRVVATKLSAIGSTRQALTAAGSITTRLLGNFQRIEHVIVVGCGGGVAHYTDAQRHVRLGDVVVAGGTNAAYALCQSLMLDRRTELPSGFNTKTYQQRDRTLVEHALQLKKESDDTDSAWANTAASVEAQLNAVMRSSQDYSFSRPPADTDNLTHDVGDGNIIAVPHPNQHLTTPRLHIGVVGGRALSLMHDNAVPSNIASKLRDHFVKEYNITAFDADFEAVIESVLGNGISSWTLVRGIADYADGMRNKQWQAYAALQAAAVARTLIESLPPPEE